MYKSRLNSLITQHQQNNREDTTDFHSLYGIPREMNINQPVSNFIARKSQLNHLAMVGIVIIKDIIDFHQTVVPTIEGQKIEGISNPLYYNLIERIYTQYEITHLLP